MDMIVQKSAGTFYPYIHMTSKDEFWLFQYFFCF